MAAPQRITRAEIEILDYISDNHPVTVRQVAEHVSRTKGQARTTVLTVMERLRRKGYLRRKKVDGVNRYSPKVARADLLKDLVADFVDGFLGGSLSPLFAYLVDSSSLSDSEVRQLDKLIRKLETQPNENDR